jgi:hypothetical protein
MSEDVCPVCYENLSITAYQESDEIEVVDACTRLACGHAFHTPCIIRCLQASSKCPCCNIFDEDALGQDPTERYERRLRLEGHCRKVLDVVKRSSKVSEYIKDYKAFGEELEEKRTVFKKKVADFKKQLRDELRIEQQIADVKKIQASTKRVFISEAKKTGNLYHGAITKLSNFRIDEYLFGIQRAWYYSIKNRRDFW